MTITTTDLSPEQIIAANVDNQPRTIEPETEQKLREVVKTTNFTMRLSFQEVSYLKRAASVLDLDWQAFLKNQIREKVLDRSGHVGEALITGPSFAAKRILGPSSK
jgi:predicted DNA binding CopG/RHH family protein